ncbi:MAG: DUF4382 domain-containing protein [Gemmatimonadales bacterium]
MFRWSRSSELYLLVALPFVFAACSGEPTGLGDPTGGAGSIEAPGPSSSDDSGAPGSGKSTGSEPGESEGGEDSGGDGGEQPLQPVGDQATGYARVVFRQSGELAGALLADVASQIQASVASGQHAGLSEEQIDFIEFTLTGVQLHRLGAVTNGDASEEEETSGTAGEEETTSAEEEGEGTSEDQTSGVSGASWVTLELEEGTLVISFAESDPEAVEANVIANGSGLEIAAGELPGGTYKNVRLLGEATITFSEDLMIGNAEYLAGEAYPLEIPSSASSGVKVETPKFSVDEGETTAVTIVFDGPESVKKIQLKPGGAKMVPVMRANVEVGTTEAPETPAP